MPMTAAELYELQQQAEYAQENYSRIFEDVGRSLGPNYTPPIGMNSIEHIESHPDVRAAKERSAQLQAKVQAGQALFGGIIYCIEKHSQLPKLMKKLATLNKRAAKIGADPIMLKLTEETTVLEYTYADDGERGFNGEFEHVYIILNGKAPQIPGFKLIAVLDHTDAGTIVKRVPTGWDGEAIYSEINLDQYHDAEPDCDHCHKLRGRKQTFIVFNEAEQSFKQIGRQCLADYTGSSDPERAAKFLEFYYEFDRSLRSSRGEKPLIPMIEFLTDVCAVIRATGYQRGETKWDAIAQYHNRRDQNKDRQGNPLWIEPTEVDQHRAAKTIELVRSLDTTSMNEFTSNTFKALSVDYLAEGTEGFVAYSPMFADKEREFQTKREIERKASEERKAGQANQSFLGEEGQRLTLTLTLVKTITLTSHYGPSETKPMYLFEDADGNQVKWISSNWKTIEIGETYEVTGTIKSLVEDERYGKSTVLTRCKLVAA